MEFVKPVKVELQKISIYLCCNTWIWSYQLHIITTCSAWGQACKQETRQQKQMQGSSGEASGPAFGMGPSAQLCEVAVFHGTTASLSHRLAQSSCIWSQAVAEASFRCLGPRHMKQSWQTAELWHKGNQMPEQMLQYSSAQNLQRALQVQCEIPGQQSSPGTACLEGPSALFHFSTFTSINTSPSYFLFQCVSSTLSASKKHHWWGQKKQTTHLYDIDTFPI